jgi:hypothetical protein
MGDRLCRWTALAAALFMLGLGVPVSAMAKPKRISGRLSEPGYTVIALAANGTARTVRAPKDRFALRPPAKSVTLQLRAPDGSYGGPIVLGGREHGKRAVVGVWAGAKLGLIKVRAARGYAKVSHPRKSAIDARRQARARRGIPIGAGKFGLVRSKPPKHPSRSDLDFDGVPDSLDIDIDGDLVLDDYDRQTNGKRTSRRARAAAVGGTFPDGSHMTLSTAINGFGKIVNVNGGSTDTQIAAAQRDGGELDVLWIGIDRNSGELDCGTLVYCSAGGTGRLDPGNVLRSAAQPFPECCDPDGDGFGSLTLWSGGPQVESMHLWHGSTIDQIHAGDVLILRATVNGGPTEFASSVGYVFSTLSAPASYSDGQGDASAFSYSSDPPAGPPNVRPGPDGRLALTFAMWRPQRPRIAGEPGEIVGEPADSEWIDVGNLQYGVAVDLPNREGQAPNFCPQGTVSTADANPSLMPSSPWSGPYPNGAGLEDHSADRPSNPENTFTYSVDVTGCLAAGGLSVSPEERLRVGFYAFAPSATGTGLSFAAFGKEFLVQP